VTDGTATFRLRVGTTHAGEPTDTEALHAALRVVREHTDDAPLDDAALQYDRVVSTDPLGKPDTGDANRENTGDIDSDTETDIDSGTAETVDSEPDEEPEPETDDRKFGIDRAGDAGDDGRQGLSRAPCGERMSTVAMSGERVRGASSRRSFTQTPTWTYRRLSRRPGLRSAARECAAERNRRRDPDATVQWVAKPTGRAADRGDVLIRCARKRTVRNAALQPTNPRPHPLRAHGQSLDPIAPRLGFRQSRPARRCRRGPPHRHPRSGTGARLRTRPRHASVVTTYCRSVNVAVRFTDTRA